MNDLKSIISHIMNVSKSKAIELRKFTKNQICSVLTNLGLAITLYFLDWSLISLARYETLRMFFNFKDILKHHNTIDRRRQTINKDMKIAFNFQVTNYSDNSSKKGFDIVQEPASSTSTLTAINDSKISANTRGYSVDPVQVLLALLEIEENETENLEHLMRKLIVKLSTDDSKGVVVLTVTLLNCKVFSVQSRD